jgi:hypothetical protein
VPAVPNDAPALLAALRERVVVADGAMAPAPRLVVGSLTDVGVVDLRSLVAVPG